MGFLIHGIVVAVALWVTASLVPGALVPGFQVAGAVPAIIGALVTSIVSWFLGLFTKGD